MKRLLCVIASVWLLAGCPSTAPVTPPVPVGTVTPPPDTTPPPLPPAAGYGTGSAENEKNRVGTEYYTTG
ncbi:hypothetical protein [Morganella morganii]|uniref:hypothetical protein n=1 Tax=Morganella morganii TaxID=582 RepID=UPI0030FEE6E4